MDSKKTNEDNGRKQGSTSQQGKGGDKRSDSKNTKKDSDKSDSRGR